MGNETAQVRVLVCFFFFFSPSSFYLCMCGNGEGFVHFLLFQNKWTNIRRGEQKILNKYNKFV